MDVHHLNTGTLCPMSARLVNGAGGLFGRARMVCHCLLVESAGGLVLVDTGLGTGDIAEPRRLGPSWVRQVVPRLDLAETALARVQALGYDPRDVRRIVLTHLDLDHAGGIADFPHASIHVHAREHRCATEREGARAGMRYIAGHFAHGPQWQTFDDGGERWFGFDGVRPLDPRDPDILLVPLPGHTLGHSGVAVRTPTGWLLHAGDAYFFHGQMDAEPHAPWVLQYFQWRGDMDRAARVANQARVRELALGHPEVKVFCAHDPVELDRFEAEVEARRAPARAPRSRDADIASPA